MANFVYKFSGQSALRGKGILVRVPGLDSAQFETDKAITTLNPLADSITTNLDANPGSSAVDALNNPAVYEAIGFKILDGQKLDLGAGGDTLAVTGNAATGGTAINAIGVSIGSGSTLDMGLAHDSVSVSLTGAGSIGLKNVGSFLTGDGNEKINLDAVKNGLVNTGTIDTGKGIDRLDATSSDGLAGSHAIYNTGTITMGLIDEADKDTLTGGNLGHGVLTENYSRDNAGIFNSGTINMGGGKDVIDALIGGFAGGGTYNLGGTKANGLPDTDADVVMGFGWGTFNGGGGRNSITLPDGTYHLAYTKVPLTIRDLASGQVQRSVGTTYDMNLDGVTKTTMTFNGFDGIGGNGLLGALHFVDAAGDVLDTFTVVGGNVSAANQHYVAPAAAPLV